MSPPIRFAICGLGFMGRTYFGHFRSHPRAAVVAVFDRNEARRLGDWTDPTGNIARVGGEQIDMTGVTPFADLDVLLARSDIHAVAVTLPTRHHAEVTVRALRAGKHVLCEKPMALRLPDCDRMIAAARDSRRTLMVAQCIRFWPQYEIIKDAVDSGRIGRVRYTTLRRLASYPTYSAGNWLLDHDQSGGGIFDLHVHDVDFAHYLLGVPASVDAAGMIGRSGDIDHVVATYRYDDGRFVTIEGGWGYTSPWPFEMAISVVGETGTLDWSSRRGTDVHLYAGGEQPMLLSPTAILAEPTPIGSQSATTRAASAAANEKPAAGAESLTGAAKPIGDGWSREIDYFVDCIAAGRSVSRCMPQSSRISIGLTLLERRSVRTGLPVRVPKCIAGLC